MSSDKNLELQLLDCERRFWQALKDGDVETAKELTDFPCILTGAQGVGRVDAASFEAMMKSPSYIIHHFELADGAHVRALSNDVAVIAYQVHEDLTVDGAPISLDAADSSTWVRRDGRWRCALHSEAIAGDPFGRDRAG